MEKSTLLAWIVSGSVLTTRSRAKSLGTRSTINQSQIIMIRQCIRRSLEELAQPGKMAHGKARAWSRRRVSRRALDIGLEGVRSIFKRSNYEKCASCIRVSDMDVVG